MNTFRFADFVHNTSNPIYPTESVKQMNWVDIFIIVIYLVGIFGIATFFFLYQLYKKKNTAKDFFAGGGKNPVWVVGLSMFATIVSSLGLLNVAGNSLQTGWMWMGINIAMVTIVPFVALWVIPFFRRIKEGTGYAYLECRFHYSLRAIGSITFVLYQIFRIALILYIPVQALSFVVEINQYGILTAVALIVIVSTAFGGFKAVIWTDAVQGVIFLIGIAAVIIGSLVQTNWHSSTMLYQHVLTKDSWKANATQGGIALIFLYNTINNIYAYTGSQDVTQRYKGTNSIAKIRKTLYITAFINVIMTLLFFGAGGALYSYFTAKGWDPASSFGGIQKGLTNNSFLVLVNQKILPVGFLGFFMASAFAASQSTISSGLSASSNTIMVDFIQRFVPNLSEKTVVWISKGIVLFIGLVSMGFGYVLVALQQGQLFNWFAGLVGLFLSPIAAVFVMAIFTKYANWKAVLIGLLLGFLVSLPIWVMYQSFIPKKLMIGFNGTYLSIVSFSIAMFISVTLSWLFNYIEYQQSYPNSNNLKWFQKCFVPTNVKVLKNRTVWTRSKAFNQITLIEAKKDQIERWAKKGDISQDLLNDMHAKLKNLDLQLDLERKQNA